MAKLWLINEDKMVKTNSKNDEFNDEYEDNIEQAFNVLMKCDMPFIILIKDMNTGKVCSTGNVGSYENGTPMMINLLLQLAANLSDISKQPNGKN